MGRLRNIGIGISQLWNAIRGGDPDETTSSRLGKLARQGNGYAMVMCWLIGLVLGPNHCETAIEEDEGEN